MRIYCENRFRRKHGDSGEFFTPRALIHVSRDIHHLAPPGKLINVKLVRIKIHVKRSSIFNEREVRFLIAIATEWNTKHLLSVVTISLNIPPQAKQFPIGM